LRSASSSTNISHHQAQIESETAQTDDSRQASVACGTFSSLALRVTHCGEEHLIQLTSAEAATLVDACALLLMASRSAPGCELNPTMTSLLHNLFEQFSSQSV